MKTHQQRTPYRDRRAEVDCFGYPEITKYEAVILRAINTQDAEVFVYRWDDTVYPTVVAELDGTRWLIMMGLDGTMETAFPPEDPEAYLADQQFRRLRTLKELGL